MSISRSVNPIVLTLMISDSIIYTGFGLMEPFIAVFISEVRGGSIMSAGIASAIFLVVKSALQLPFSRYIDSHEHPALSPKNYISSMFLWLGVGIVVLVPFGYYFVTDIWQVYALQALFGIGSALAYPTWLKLWELHLDRGRESFEWTLYSTSVSLMTAGAAVVGGTMIEYYGFRPTFLVAGFVAAIGGSVLVYLRSDAKNIVPMTKPN